jgi:hypothetical protein
MTFEVLQWVSARLLVFLMVQEAVSDGVADADAVAFVVVFAVVAVVDAACDRVSAAGLLLVGDVQPAIDNEAITTSMMMANNSFFIQIPQTKK